MHNMVTYIKIAVLVNVREGGDDQLPLTSDLHTQGVEGGGTIEGKPSGAVVEQDTRLRTPTVK